MDFTCFFDPCDQTSNQIIQTKTIEGKQDKQKRRWKGLACSCLSFKTEGQGTRWHYLRTQSQNSNSLNSHSRITKQMTKHWNFAKGHRNQKQLECAAQSTRESSNNQPTSQTNKPSMAKNGMTMGEDWWMNWINLDETGLPLPNLSKPFHKCIEVHQPGFWKNNHVMPSKQVIASKKTSRLNGLRLILRFNTIPNNAKEEQGV